MSRDMQVVGQSLCLERFKIMGRTLTHWMANWLPLFGWRVQDPVSIRQHTIIVQY